MIHIIDLGLYIHELTVTAQQLASIAQLVIDLPKSLARDRA